MHINGNFLFGRFGAAQSSPGLGRVMPEPDHASETDDPLQTLEWRLHAAQRLLRPGFMTLRAVRHGGLIVDFMWIFASAGAGRMLGHDALDLYGKRLLDVLAGHSGREAVFEQYRCVVELGAAVATRQVDLAHGARDTIRHGAVRLDDGVAVTLINVSAAHRAQALALALEAQQAMAATAQAG
jgi:hypothetical protein